MKEIINRVLTMIENSTVTSGLIALSLGGAVVYMAVTSQAIPEALSVPFGVVIGYFFASKQNRTKVEALVAQAAKAAKVE